MARRLFELTNHPLDVSDVVSIVTCEPVGKHGTCGAVATFLGLVRDANMGRRVIRLEYEAYEPLAISVFARIAEEARSRWTGMTLAIHHRLGRIDVGETSIVIAAAAPHRAEAFAACRYAIERIKQIAPIWKHEFFDGGDVWIEGASAHPEDERARDDAFKRACA